MKKQQSTTCERILALIDDDVQSGMEIDWTADCNTHEHSYYMVGAFNADSDVEDVSAAVSAQIERVLYPDDLGDVQQYFIQYWMDAVRSAAEQRGYIEDAILALESDDAVEAAELIGYAATSERQWGDDPTYGSLAEQAEEIAYGEEG